ncbi:MAG TPA: MFS transporter [Gammaproteobacteria bacterium]
MLPTVTAVNAQPHRGSFALPLMVIAFGQLISWGTLYYGITFMAQPIQNSTAWERKFIFMGYSLALLLSGLLLPWVGRLIQRRGARFALTSGMLLASAGFFTIALAEGTVAYLVGWAINGVAMALALYETAFAALSELRQMPLRRAIGIVTIVGGMASTAFWPLTALLVEQVGWRTTLIMFGTLHALVLAPMYWRLLPSLAQQAPTAPVAAALPPPANAKRRLWLFSAAFGALAFVSTGLVAHFTLIMAGVEQATLLFALALIGPAQIAMRVIDIIAPAGRKIVALGLASTITLAIASLLLLFSNAQAAMAIGVAILFGMGNGGMTIVRGMVPREYFSTQHYAVTLAALSRATHLLRAFGPIAVAVGFTLVGVGGVLQLFVVLTLSAAALFYLGSRTIDG